MKGIFILVILILNQGNIIGQKKTVKKKEIINPIFKELLIKVEKLKSEPTSLARDTSLIYHYYELARQPEIGIQAISAYIDTMSSLSNKNQWEKGNWHIHWTMTHLANVKQALGLWDETEELKLKAIHYFRSTNDSASLNYAMLMWANNLWDMGRYDQSLKILQDYIPLAESKRNANLSVAIFTNLGYNYTSKKMYPEGKLYFEKAYNLRNSLFAQGNLNSTDSLKRLIELKVNLIEVYLLNNQKAKAEKMIPWVLYANNTAGGDFEKYRSYSQFANAYIEIGEFKKAEKFALECAKYAKLLASRAHDLVVNTNLYKIYKGLGKNDLALKYLEELKKVEAALAFDKMNAKVTELQLKYDTEAKQKRISELTLEKQKQIEKSLFVGLLFLIGLFGYVFFNNRQLRRKNREITEAMLQGQTTERRRVAIDLHDNLGSTLSSIGWSMDAIDQSKMTKKELEVYKNLQTMIATAYDEVRLLSHNLLPEELEKKGLVTALQTLVRKLNNSSTKTHFELIISENFDSLNKKTEFELYSISLELVNNILKHSKATEAKIKLLKNKNEVSLSIYDNGIGLFKNESDGKGMKNVQARVDSLGGKWELKAKENEGTNSLILIPV